jgi:hypothetical protein
VKAGKRTYFFDVKESKNGERYLTITESKRHFDDASGQFSYDKHKLFLYPEDMENFMQALQSSVAFVETGNAPENHEKDMETQDFDTIGDFESDSLF